MADYGHYCRPGLVDFLDAIGLNVQYERAEGDSMWLRRGEHLTEVADFIGGYGASLFGHNHPELVAELRCALDQRVPVLAQASCRSGAGRLAKALCERLGDYVVVFTNSGTETIEAALKHAFLERHKPVFWAVKGAFHGKTLGSIQLTWSYAAPFKDVGPAVRFLDPDDPDDWREAEKSLTDVAAIFVEPIRGEGGVRPLPPGFVAWLIGIREKAGVPLIVDEIQTGMGRTGTFLASEQVGIEPDYVCLSKALGGGLVKIGALLIKRERFIEEFSVIHTSTFAEDELSCRVALKALEILDRDALPQRCAASGAYMLAQLKALQAAFPEQISEVRGAGLMIGVELQDQSDSPSNSFLMLSRQKYLGYAAASYLLNAHNIRIAPTLSDRLTLRMEPSAYISLAAIDRCIGALVDFCQSLHALDAAPFVRPQLGKSQVPARDYTGKHPSIRERPATDARVGFIGNLILPEHAALFDPSLAEFTPEELETYLTKISKMVEPAIYDRINVRSNTGDAVHLNFIGLVLTSRQIMESIRSGDSKWVLEKIKLAVTLASEEGCTVVGLGGHTSIVSGSGLLLRPNGVALTSGNSLTVGMAIAAVRRAADRIGISPSQVSLGVVGAAGNIGSTLALMLSPHVASTYLVARYANSPRLAALVESIRIAAPGHEVYPTDRLDALRHCSIVVCASNSPQSLVFAEHLAPSPVVLADLAVPGDVDSSVSRERPDVHLVRDILVRLPHNDNFRIAGIPLRLGHVFPCMAETILMGLEGMRTHGSFGSITPAGVQLMCALAARHQFSLAD